MNTEIENRLEWLEVTDKYDYRLEDEATYSILIKNSEIALFSGTEKECLDELERLALKHINKDNFDEFITNDGNEILLDDETGLILKTTLDYDGDFQWSIFNKSTIIKDGEILDNQKPSFTSKYKNIITCEEDLKDDTLKTERKKLIELLQENKLNGEEKEHFITDFIADLQIKQWNKIKDDIFSKIDNINSTERNNKSTHSPK